MNQESRHVLASLNVGPDEEDVYRVLLALPGSSTAELVEHIPFGQHRIRRAVAGLERKAIITRRGGSPIRYQPAPPDVAVEALISVRQEELNRARLGATELMALLRVPPMTCR